MFECCVCGAEIKRSIYRRNEGQCDACASGWVDEDSAEPYIGTVYMGEGNDAHYPVEAIDDYVFDRDFGING